MNPILDRENSKIIINHEENDAYKSALKIILALCEKMSYKTSDIETVETICKTVLQKEV